MVGGGGGMEMKLVEDCGGKGSNEVEEGGNKKSNEGVGGWVEGGGEGGQQQKVKYHHSFKENI